MCGRYYIDKTAQQVLEDNISRYLSNPESLAEIIFGDICPGQKAPVICTGENGQIETEKSPGETEKNPLKLEMMTWGFPRYDGKGLLINARGESALEKASFKESVRRRRCVIPAKGFYEWNRSREKFQYEYPEQSVIYMAGCYQRFESGLRFVILTTAANDSVSPVHDRMPLVLEQEEIPRWILEDDAVEFILHKTPKLLDVKTEYEQMTLF